MGFHFLLYLQAGGWHVEQRRPGDLGLQSFSVEVPFSKTQNPYRGHSYVADGADL